MAGFSYKPSSQISGVGVLNCVYSSDSRGSFIKTFTKGANFPSECDIQVQEEFFSISHKNVIRGMHFQTPPHDHLKHVQVLRGSILDVVLDLRKHSPSFGKYETFELSEKVPQILVIPKGCAHGFLSLEDSTTVSYRVDAPYKAENDTGVKYDSFGFKWPTNSPIVSVRDMGFLSLKDFSTPF